MSNAPSSQHQSPSKRGGRTRTQTPPDSELRKPVAETLEELQDYLKEVGEPTLPKTEGGIPCAPPGGRRQS